MEKKENRKIKITKMVLQDSLIELMKTKPILSITIKDICEVADMSRSTFYAHYNDQYDLLRQIEKETLGIFEDILSNYKDAHNNKEIAQMLEEILTYIANNSNSIQVLLSENGDINFQKKIFQHFVNNKQVTKYFSEDLKDNEDYYSVFIIHGAIGLVQHWLKNNASMPVPHLAKMLVKWTH